MRLGTTRFSCRRGRGADRVLLLLARGGAAGFTAGATAVVACCVETGGDTRAFALGAGALLRVGCPTVGAGRVLRGGCLVAEVVVVRVVVAGTGEGSGGGAGGGGGGVTVVTGCESVGGGDVVPVLVLGGGGVTATAVEHR